MWRGRCDCYCEGTLSSQRASELGLSARHSHPTPPHPRLCLPSCLAVLIRPVLALPWTFSTTCPFTHMRVSDPGTWRWRLWSYQHLWGHTNSIAVPDPRRGRCTVCNLRRSHAALTLLDVTVWTDTGKKGSCVVLGSMECEHFPSLVNPKHWASHQSLRWALSHTSRRQGQPTSPQEPSFPSSKLGGLVWGFPTIKHLNDHRPHTRGSLCSASCVMQDDTAISAIYPRVTSGPTELGGLNPQLPYLYCSPDVTHGDCEIQ